MPPAALAGSFADVETTPSSAAREPPGRTRTIALDEGPVHVRILGRGAPLLFLHGISARGRSWADAAADVVAGREVQAWLPDLLGRGASGTGPDLRFSLDDEVRRADALVDALARTEAGAPAVIVGHSTGAAIALGLARLRPHVLGLLLSNPVSADIRRPRALGLLRSGLMRKVLAGIFSPLHRSLGARVIRRAGGPGYRAPSEVVEAYSAPYADRRRAETLMRILADWRPSELAAHMPDRRLVVRVVAGAHDPRVPPAAAEALAGALGGTFTLVEDGGHILPEQHPERLAREIGALLDDVGT